VMTDTRQEMKLSLIAAGVGLALAAPAARPTLITSVMMDAGMALHLTIESDIGVTNQIQYATNLAQPVAWVALTNIAVTQSPYSFVDLGAFQAPRRFYRVLVKYPASAPANMVWIPPGTFTMGSPANEQDRYSNEGPQTVVTLTNGFFIGKYEVTQGDYRAVMGSNPSNFPGDTNRPVEMVSWINATNYCAELTWQEESAGRLPPGWVYRLPTEAEWEYACRAGTTTRFSFGNDETYAQLGSYAWYSSNSGSTTHPVGTKLPNPWGLYDMSGNVREWCWDWDGTYPGGSVTNPSGPDSGSFRVVRNGGWSNSGANCRSALRSSNYPSYIYYNIGFRVVLARK
jgi:formylglycine-generating enzyme required for sulfatase activity